MRRARSLVAALALAAALLAGCTAPPAGDATPPTASTPAPPSVGDGHRLQPGESATVVVDAGSSETRFIEDDLGIRFGRPGTEFSVPDLLLGGAYVFDDPPRVAHAPILAATRVARGGTSYLVELIECDKEERFTDVREVVVTRCSVRVTREDAAANASWPAVARSWNLTGVHETYREDARTAFFGARIASDPFVYVGVQDFFVESSGGRVVGGAQGGTGSPEGPVRIQVYARTGIADLSFTPEEMHEGAARTVDLGPIRLTVSAQPHRAADRLGAGDFTYRVEADAGQGAGSDRWEIIGFSYAPG